MHDVVVALDLVEVDGLRDASVTDPHFAPG